MRYLLFTLLFALAVPGCAWRAAVPNPLGTAPIVENPVFVPVADREATWEQIIDVVDDYFEIEHEDRVRVVGDVLTEGRIDTRPRIGSTFLEPWRRDSVGRYEKWLATLQTIRRRATLNVRPVEGGFLVDVTVHKELEDLERSQFATAGAAQQRYDSGPKRLATTVGGPPQELGWMPLGRDIALEQRIVAHLQSRFLISPAATNLPIRLPPVQF